jgi:predicted DNA-binding protein
MKMAKEQARIILSIPVPPTLKKRLRQLAKADGRTLASYARQTLAKHAEASANGEKSE